MPQARKNRKGADTNLAKVIVQAEVRNPAPDRIAMLTALVYIPLKSDDLMAMMVKSITELNGNMKDFMSQHKRDRDDVARSLRDLTQCVSQPPGQGQGREISRDFCQNAGNGSATTSDKTATHVDEGPPNKRQKTGNEVSSDEDYDSELEDNGGVVEEINDFLEEERSPDS